MTNFHFAPVQGHTDAAYRHFHSKIYGGDQNYYTPFIRLEKDNLRPKDLKDLTSPLNDNVHLVPQIIFRDKYELNTLVTKIKELGLKEIDLNMGCPFPLQTGHRRGAATIKNEELAKEVVSCVQNNPDIHFSIKMRLGMEDPVEWKTLLPYLNTIKLKHITLHPRIAKQQYTGEVDLNQFSDFLNQSLNPVVYNGDIKTPEEIKNIMERFPKIEGIMVGRGILARPSLFTEFSSNQDWDSEARKRKMLEFHKELFKHYSNILCGDAQIISKIKPFWEFAEEEIGRKPWKAIKKAVNLSKYQSAIALNLL